MSLPQTKEEGTQKILFAKVPDAENLCCIVAWYEENDKPTTSVYSFYQWTTLKCRYLFCLRCILVFYNAFVCTCTLLSFGYTGKG